MHLFSCSGSRTHTAGADVPEHTLEAAILPAAKDKQLAEDPITTMCDGLFMIYDARHVLTLAQNKKWYVLFTLKFIK
jgi:hypothetical protein